MSHKQFLFAYVSPTRANAQLIHRYSVLRLAAQDNGVEGCIRDPGLHVGVFHGGLNPKSRIGPQIDVVPGILEINANDQKSRAGQGGIAFPISVGVAFLVCCGDQGPVRGAAGMTDFQLFQIRAFAQFQ